jgi:hypothetical protein
MLRNLQGKILHIQEYKKCRQRDKNSKMKLKESTRYQKYYKRIKKPMMGSLVHRISLSN